MEQLPYSTLVPGEVAHSNAPFPLSRIERIMSYEQRRMNIRISLLSDEVREDSAARKLRIRHKRATTFTRNKGESAAHMIGIEKKAIRARVTRYENTRI